jgi:hypothetical protein
VGLYPSWGDGLEDKPEKAAEVQSLCQDFTSMGKELTNLKWITNIATISGGASEPLAPVIQDAGFKLWGSASIVSDPAASDGSAALSPNVVGWNVQWHWGKLGFIPNQTYSLYARIKVDKTSSAIPGQTACGAGVWGPSSGQVLSKTILVQDIGSSYQDILIGTFTPSDDQYVYISGSAYAEVPHIYVDKFWMTQNVQAYTAGDVQTFMADSPFRRDDIGDLGILAANYGVINDSGWTITWRLGDFNGDGVVDIGDLGILAANYGAGSNESSDFSADYAKAFGARIESNATTTEVDTNVSNDAGTEEVSNSICSCLGLPLIVGVMITGLMLVRVDK